PAQGGLAPTNKSRQHHFRVRVGTEAPLIAQLLTQFAPVINFAVIGEVPSAIGTGHWLCPSRAIHQREPGIAQRGMGIDNTPESSGPRCRIRRSIISTALRESSAGWSKRTMPAMAHINRFLPNDG